MIFMINNNLLLIIIMILITRFIALIVILLIIFIILTIKIIILIIILIRLKNGSRLFYSGIRDFFILVIWNQCTFLWLLRNKNFNILHFNCRGTLKITLIKCGLKL